jgi:NTE family protein
MNNVTLVCGGGGVWGVGWMTGIAMGFAECGLDLREAASFVGTSAGAIIGTQLASGLDPQHLYTRQTDPATQPYELSPNLAGMTGMMMELMQRSFATPRERLRAVCDIAVRTHTVSPAERRASIAARLGLQSEVWPAKRLSITAVDVDSLELEVFDAQSAASVVDAVAASCAVPGLWPPTPINGRRYIDGGVWGTAENAQLALGSSHVLILSPLGGMSGSPMGEPERLVADVGQLRASGAQVSMIAADEASRATMAYGLLDPKSRKPAAEAGRRQSLQETAASALFSAA